MKGIIVMPPPPQVFGHEQLLAILNGVISPTMHIERAKTDYINGLIEIEELEQRIEAGLKAAGR